MTCIVGIRAVDAVYIGADTLISSIYNCDTKIVKKENAVIGCLASRCGYNFIQSYNFPERWDEDDIQINRLWNQLRTGFPFPQYNIGFVMTGGKHLIQMWNGMGWSRLHKTKEVMVAAANQEVTKMLTVLGEKHLKAGEVATDIIQMLLDMAEKMLPEVRGPFLIESL